MLENSIKENVLYFPYDANFRVLFMHMYVVGVCMCGVINVRKSYNADCKKVYDDIFYYTYDELNARRKIYEYSCSGCCWLGALLE